MAFFFWFMVLISEIFSHDDHGELSSVNMGTAVAVRTLKATYKSSQDAASIETMILKLTEKEGPSLESKGNVDCATRVAVLTWRSLLIMSREWKCYWLRLILYTLLALCIGTIFSGLGHSLSSVGLKKHTEEWTVEMEVPLVQ